MSVDGGDVYRFACLVERLSKESALLEEADRELQSALSAGEKVYDKRGRPVGAALRRRWAWERLEAARRQASWYRGRFGER